MTSKEICERFEQGDSVKSISKNIGCSWNRVVKILSTNGYVVNNTHKQILDLFERGLPTEKIAAQMNLNIKTVQSYLPGVRGCVYGENQSKNAERIKKHRNKKTRRSQIYGR